MTFWFRVAFTWWLGHFISRHFKVHFMLIKYTYDSKSQTLHMRYPFQSTGNQQTDLTSKRMVVSRSHHAVVAKFRTGVKFSPRCNNRGEVTWSSLEIRIIRKIENLFDSFVNGMEPWGSVNLKIRIRQGQPTTVFYKRYVRKHCLEISIAWENLNMVVLFVFRISIVSTIFGYWAGFLFKKKSPKIFGFRYIDRNCGLLEFSSSRKPFNSR